MLTTDNLVGAPPNGTAIQHISDLQSNTRTYEGFI